MIEIAISLAIIGIALVSIIGVLPIGLHTQRDNRQETLINQDATVLMEAIRGAARGSEDLTNYVFAITNYWTFYKVNGRIGQAGTNGYIFGPGGPASAYVAPGYVNNPSLPYNAGSPITNGINIIGLLSTPEYTDLAGLPIPDLSTSGFSNHVVAYVRSLSGLAVVQPPQANPLMRADSFGYRVLCVNAPVPTPMPPRWDGTVAWNAGSSVSYLVSGQNAYTFWQATAFLPAGTTNPGSSPLWQRVFYPQDLGANLRELRLTFYWPLLPNNGLPGDVQHLTFRTLVAGPLQTNLDTGQLLYLYQPQSFVATP